VTIRSYIIFDKATGRILGNVNCPEDHIDFQIQDGQDALQVECQVDDTAFYVDSEVLVAMPDQTSPRHVFDWKKKKWVLPFGALSEEAHARAAERAGLLEKITVLERGQYRAMRELLISLSTGTQCSQDALDQLVGIDGQIEALRSKL
jgi:hypothetical protein